MFSVNWHGSLFLQILSFVLFIVTAFLFTWNGVRYVSYGLVHYISHIAPRNTAFDRRGTNTLQLQTLFSMSKGLTIGDLYVPVHKEKFVKPTIPCEQSKHKITLLSAYFLFKCGLKQHLTACEGGECKTPNKHKGM